MLHVTDPPSSNSGLHDNRFSHGNDSVLTKRPLVENGDDMSHDDELPSAAKRSRTDPLDDAALQNHDSAGVIDANHSGIPLPEPPNHLGTVAMVTEPP
jgi:hypothetical protein